MTCCYLEFRKRAPAIAGGRKIRKKTKIEIRTKTLLENRKTVDHESDGDTNCNWDTRYSHQRFGTKTGGLGNKRTSEDHPNYSIIEIGQNTEKSLGDLRRLTVTQTPVEDHQLMLVWKTIKRVK